MSFYDDYMDGMETLKTLTPSSAGKVAMAVILGIILVIGLALWFTPWIQTASGFGIVNTVSPEDRRQAISALVPGQIEKWHVIEGQSVKAGDPIVTLRDQDSELVARLRAELQAKQQEKEAAEIALLAAEQDLERQETLLE